MILLMRWAFVGGVVCLAAGSVGHGATAEPTKTTEDLVGEWTDSGRMEFSGLKTFTAHQLRLALSRDLTYQLASHPQAPRAKLIPTLEERLTVGFRHAGFPEASVRATMDQNAGRMRINITEGPRYDCGEVKVRGAVTAPTNLLVRRLTAKWPPPDRQSASKLAGGNYLNSAGKEVEEEEPDWEAGEAAPFDAVTLEAITSRLTNSLAELGYFLPKVKLRVQPRANSGLADLLIDIESEGPHGKLGRIEVSGLKRNATEALLKWLALAPGQPVGDDLIGRIERQLWNSGRFLSYRVQPVPSPAEPEVVDVELWLKELPEAPLLGKEFSREEQVMLKFRDWLLAAPLQGDDLVLSVGVGGPLKALFDEVELIISGQGFLAVGREGGKVRHGLTLAHGRTEFFAAARQRKLTLTDKDYQPALYLTIAPENDPKSESPFHIELRPGFEGRTDGEAGARPLKLNFLLAPAVFVYLAHPTNHTIKLAGNTLTFSGDDTTMKIDAASGRLIELTGELLDESWPARVKVERRAFERMQKELDSVSAALPNALDEKRPASFFLGALGAEFFQFSLLTTNVHGPTNSAQVARAVSAAERVYTQAFAALDSLIATNWWSSNSFSIPAASGKSDSGEPFAGLGGALSRILGLADQVLPAQSWPWTLTREAVFELSGEGRYTEAELQRLYDAEETGPIGCLVTALLLKKIHSSEGAKRFAVQGLERMSLADFRKDCQVVLGKESTFGQMFVNAVQALCELPAEDFEALAGLLPERDAAVLRRFVTQLNSSRSRPAMEALSLWLDDLWQSSLRDRVDKALRALGGSAVAVAERARRYAEGYKLYKEQDYAAAAKVFREVADQDHPDAQLALARMLQNGTGIAQDEKAALYWTYRAASNGVMDAQMTLGAHHSMSIDGPANPVESFFWYSLAANSGDKAAETFRNIAGRKLSPEQLKEAERRLALFEKGKAKQPSKK